LYSGFSMPFTAELSLRLGQCALAIFCRAPQLGTVKTRLAASRGNEFALELYRVMLADSFALGRALAPQVETFACFTPDDAFKSGGLQLLWNGPRMAQCPGDLGTRMLHCFRQLRAQGAERIVLLGSDSPDLPIQYLEAAFEALGQSDIVVGPSEDGGFYLIGASVPLADSIFTGIIWSSPQVYGRLLENLEQQTPHLGFATLPAWRDVDDEADLVELEYRLQDANTSAPQTRAFVMGKPGQTSEV
jgi:rSAM/selenodomain-associated transferase 1